MNLFSRIEEWKNFAGTNFRRFAKKTQNPRKLISQEWIFVKIYLVNVI